MKAQVLCRVRPGVSLTFNVKGDSSLMGRDTGLAIPVPLDGVSRRHAKILWDGKTHWLEDLGSTNGTFLNGQPVGREKLRHLDVIGLGKAAELLFVLRSEEAQSTVKRRGIVKAALYPEGAEAEGHDIPAGEITLGRSSACNVVAERGVVSKVHAKIQRTLDQLVVEDLGSSNGTFVNGERVMTAVLGDGDVISLAAVEGFRVAIEMGEVTSSSGVFEAPAAPAAPAAEDRPRFSAEWKTRFEWDAAELAELAEMQKRVGEQREQTKRPEAPKAAKLGGAAAAPAAAKPAAPAPKAAPAPAPPAPKPAAAAAPPVAPKAPTPAAAPKPATAKPAAPAPAAPAESAPPPTIAVAAAVPPPAPAPEVPKAPTAIAEIRLTAPGFSLVATETGAHELGRAKEAPLRVNHPTVSREHARIILSDDRMIAYLQHTSGANGTFLNGVLLDKLQPLSEGDTIMIGEVTLRVSLRRR